MPRTDTDTVLTRAIAAHERAIVQRVAGRFAAAERDCRRAVDGFTRAEGAQSPDLANALVELGRVLEARDRLAEAAACHRRALAILGRAGRHPDFTRLAIEARLALAGVQRTRGELRQADQLNKAALAAARRLGPRDPLVATALNNLGVLRKAEGRYAEAAALYERAAPLLARRDAQARATLHHNLGGIAHARGRFAEAEPHARRAVTLREAALGTGHPVVAADVAALAAVVEARGRYVEAARLYRRALAIFGRHLGSGSLEAGLAEAGLAAVEQQRGRVAPAARLYAHAIRVLERKLGRDHADVALTVNNLAVLHQHAGRLREAAALFQRAGRGFQRSLGADHPHTRLAKNNLKNTQLRLKGVPTTRR
ncbi:MAG TPA: tetratricopeptide repeat protein [Polyangia bacterium]|nr:tetratricopeptide repeat protein [Polyangia bacterium]